MATGLRERKKEEQRVRILGAAVALFRERGFDETRVQDVLEAADVSLGTFYNYFPGKNAVLDAFGAEVIGSYVRLAAEELAAGDQTPADRVRALARACGRAFSSDPDFMTVVVTRARAFGGRGDLPVRDDPIYELLTRLFAGGQESGHVRADVPAIQLGEIFSGIFMFTVVSWLAERRSAGAG